MDSIKRRQEKKTASENVKMPLVTRQCVRETKDIYPYFFFKLSFVLRKWGLKKLGPETKASVSANEQQTSLQLFLARSHN